VSAAWDFTGLESGWQHCAQICIRVAAGYFLQLRQYAASFNHILFDFYIEVIVKFEKLR